MNKIINRKQDFLISLIYIAMIYSLTALIGGVIGLSLNTSTQLLIIASISSIVRLFIIYPISFFISSIIGFLSMLFINKYKFPIFPFIQDRSITLFLNIIENLQNADPIADSNILLFYLIIVLFTSIFTGLIIYRIKKPFILAGVYLSIFLIYWYSFVDEAFIFTAIFLFLFLILFGIDKYNKDSKINSKSLNIWTATSIVYSVLIVSIAFVLPKSIDYISWPSLQEKVYKQFPLVEDLRYYKEGDRKGSNPSPFNFSNSGFSEDDKELGGPLVLSERKVMTVESKEPLYLRGNVKHFYTGRSWMNQSYGFEEHYLKQDFSSLLDSQKESFFIQSKINIVFDSFSSKTIFAPYKPVSISSNRNFPIFVNADEIISSDDGVYKNEGYTVEFLKPLPYEILIQNRPIERKTDLMDLSSYLELPEDTITDRTKELTKSLVEGLNTDYEKAIAIQDHLRNNYKYNLNVKELPEGEDFVDHFLFEEKEGYCTYYATAMAVMLRFENIPTRYVEGYIVNEEIDPGKYQVRQKHAHAWVEAFIEPVGWTSFEPTAAYQPLDDETIEEYDIVPDTEEETESIDLPQVHIEDEDEVQIIEVEDKIIDNQTDSNMYIFTIVLLGPILLFLLFLILRALARYCKYKAKEKHFNSLKNKEKAIFLYKDTIDLVSILGFTTIVGETHFEYINRIDFKFIDSKGYSLKDITDIFVKLKYSDEQVSDTQLASISGYKKDLDKKLQGQIGKFRYLYRKYINIYFTQKKEIP